MYDFNAERLIAIAGTVTAIRNTYNNADYLDFMPIEHLAHALEGFYHFNAITENYDFIDAHVDYTVGGKEIYKTATINVDCKSGKACYHVIDALNDFISALEDLGVKTSHNDFEWSDDISVRFQFNDHEILELNFFDGANYYLF